MTPIGISPAISALAKSSTINMNKAPISIDVGSKALKFGPTRNLVMCGMTRPTQPIIPQRATEEAVSSVEQITIARRRRPVFMPMDWTQGALHEVLILPYEFYPKKQGDSVFASPKSPKDHNNSQTHYSQLNFYL